MKNKIHLRIPIDHILKLRKKVIIQDKKKESNKKLCRRKVYDK